jgi:hypothetical protein
VPDMFAISSYILCRAGLCGDAVLCIIYLEEIVLLLVGGNQIAQWGQDAF